MAADSRELAGLAPRLRSTRPASLDLRWSLQGQLGDTPVVLAAHGVGRSNAGHVVAHACEHLAVRAVVSTGWCGALDPSMALGQIVIASRVLSLAPPAEFWSLRPLDAPADGPVLTVDRFVQTAEEKTALRSTGAVAVEMEAAGVAAEAHKRSLPFFCVRIVSDVAGESFNMDFNLARLADGRFSILRILLQAGASPARWRELLEVWRRDGLVAGALGEYLARKRFHA